MTQLQLASKWPPAEKYGYAFSRNGPVLPYWENFRIANRILVQDATTASTSTSHVLRPAIALGRQYGDDRAFNATLRQGQVLKWLCVVMSQIVASLLQLTINGVGVYT